MSHTTRSDQGPTVDLVAFEVEGSGFYLVPLDTFAEFEVEPAAPDSSVASVGWGWALPIVRWNTFHPSQVGTALALAPGVITALSERHFIALTTRPLTTRPLTTRPLTTEGTTP